MSTRYAPAALSLLIGFGCAQAPPPAVPPPATPPAAAATADAAPAADTTSPAQGEPVAATETPAAAAAPADSEIAIQPKSWEETAALIREQAGKVVVVDVWSTSCEPCLREFPNLVALQKQFPQEVVCIGLNCDYSGLKKRPPEFYRERILKILEQHQARIINVQCTEPSDDLFAALDVDAIPAILIYDRAGKLAHKLVEGSAGLTYEKNVTPAVQALLKPDAP